MTDTVTTAAVKVCPDCAVAPGERHVEGCDVARCKVCGVQTLQCDEHEDASMTVWTGRWPGEDECAELGFWCRWKPPEAGERYGAWVPCPRDHPEAQTDLNKLGGLVSTGWLLWDSVNERYVPLAQPATVVSSPAGGV